HQILNLLKFDKVLLPIGRFPLFFLCRSLTILGVIVPWPAHMTLLDMENKESILSALNTLESNSNAPTPPILEEYLREIAKHGLTFIPWVHIKPLILQKFNRVVDKFIEDAKEVLSPSVFQTAELNKLKERVYNILRQFEGTPFTIQRLCELLIQPRKHYTRPDKYLRGFEKACLVVSTIDCFGNKIHNVDPRLSGSIEESSTGIANGSFTDGASTSSAEESSTGTKRSDEEDDDIEEDSVVPHGSIIATRRPCINFYRPLASPACSADRASPSKSTENTHKSINDNLFGSHSPGIPGKYTLQRPFLIGASSSFRPLSEESSRQNVEREEEGENAMEEGARILSIQKLFSETGADEAGKSTLTSTTAVPPIDQMLRPMGQLEAFVNTISIDTTTTTSTAPGLSTVTSTDSSQEHVEEGFNKNEGEYDEIVASASDEEKAETSEIDIEIPEPPTSTDFVEGSLKRDSPIFDGGRVSLDPSESPAKRRRISESETAIDSPDSCTHDLSSDSLAEEDASGSNSIEPQQEDSPVAGTEQAEADVSSDEVKVETPDDAEDSLQQQVETSSNEAAVEESA
uniref:Serine/threonine-protein phosphatase 4 regulatory subunit 2 n=1 Tax=Mesocestoides corti TaxID=53468 RepID=A0A5K3F9Q3_MESCO